MTTVYVLEMRNNAGLKIAVVHSVRVPVDWALLTPFQEDIV